MAEAQAAFPDEAFDAAALALAERSAGIGVWSIDLTTGLVRGTAQFFRILGLAPTRDPVPLDSIRALRHPEDRERVLAGFRSALEDGTDAYEIEYRILRPDGELRWIFGRGRIVRDAAGKPVRYSGVDLDITARKAAEAALAAAKEELERMNQALEDRVRERTAALVAEVERRVEAEARYVQAQKMEAVGQLTGGIAHDFNNILQVIVGNLEIARLTLQREAPDAWPAEPHGRILEAIERGRKAAASAQQLVQRLLAFGRAQSLSPAVIDVNALIAGMADMIGRTIGETIKLETTLAPGLWPVDVDVNQLEAALLNLAVNARDAMPDGGRLVLATANVELRGADADEVAHGDYVLLRVGDTGVGIAKELLPRVFEPFFSTKPSGKGSGLGLSMVYGFVNQSGGHVQIDSDVGRGTTVRIYLPRAHGAPEMQPAAPVERVTRDALPRARAGETVLLVEDNDEVRRFGAAALEDLGYRVLPCSDAGAALRALDGVTPVDLLFTDVVLAGPMSGGVLAEAVRAARPQLPVLFTSGYTGGATDGRSVAAARGRLLAKPYALASLARAVREAIDGGAAVGNL